jgi:ubiquinone/menaquinone biosynthesis C-methylase UbiE
MTVNEIVNAVRGGLLGQRVRFHVPGAVARSLLPASSVLANNFPSLFHGKAHRGLSRRTRHRKHQHVHGLCPHIYRPKGSLDLRMKSIFVPPPSPSSFMDRYNFSPTHPIPILQKRAFSGNYHCVTDEDVCDSILHERELELYRHYLGPIRTIVETAKDTIEGHIHHKTEHDIKVLDIASQPIDPSVSLVKEIPNVVVKAIGDSAAQLKLVADRISGENLPNLSTELSDLINLSEFEDSSIDLVTSCYGLQSSPDPAKLISEIHRVLKPGGSMILAVWEHLGTTPIVDLMAERVLSGSHKNEERSPLMKPHVLENMIEDSGLWVIDIKHGQFPFCISEDNSHSSAFDLVSLPIKKELGNLITSGERPYGFEDARAVFDDVVAKGDLIMTDPKGRLIVEDNRYKVIVARRRHEDNDRRRDIEAKRRHSHEAPQVTPILDSAAEKVMAEQFDNVLLNTFPKVTNSPWKLLTKAVKRDLDAAGHDVAQTEKKVSILDISSSPTHFIQVLAESFPNVNIFAANHSPAIVEDIRKCKVDQQLDNVSVNSISDGKLADCEDKSMDVITCSFGLTSFSDPEGVMKEVHRVLKPGGSLITTTWDSIALERIGERIMSLIAPQHQQEARILNLSDYSTPRKLERMIESEKLGIVKVEHFDFPMELGKGGASVDDAAFNLAMISIRHLLRHAVESGSNPHAFEDAKRAFETLVEEEELMLISGDGRLMTVPNRFKLLVARRKFETGDGVLDKSELDRFNRE